VICDPGKELYQMRLLTLAFCLLITVVCLAQPAAPSFEQVHEQTLRILGNEAGVGARLPDADGIIRSLTSHARNPDRTIDLPRLMSRMVRHSTRTFPLDSEWRSLVGGKRLAELDKLRTPRNAWSSQLTLSCERPAAWDVSVEGVWKPERCFALVDITKGLLTGKIRSRCSGTPHTWGSEADVEKRNIRNKMREIFCDRPRTWVPGNTVDCPALRADRSKAGRRLLANHRECARNTFWRW
jgi:hypothetical protein